jgi:DNA mismatch endonuclease (patch repair protein)
VDRLTRTQRSANMRAIRAFGTKPEFIMRRVVCELGLRNRYRLHLHSLPGRPDLVFPTLGKIIFVHGCFWHCHRGCPAAHVPASNYSYWGPKLRRTAARDRKHLQVLASRGWQVLTVWECELAGSLSATRQKILTFLRSPASTTSS